MFVDEDSVRQVLLQLRQAADAEWFAVTACCFMPDHMHALVEGCGQNADFLRFVRLFKQQSAYDWKCRSATELWQRGYYEHVLRSDEDAFAVARYLLENPVRAGLARSPGEYPFLGSFTMNVEALLDSALIPTSSPRSRRG